MKYNPWNWSSRTTSKYKSSNSWYVAVIVLLFKLIILHLSLKPHKICFPFKIITTFYINMDVSVYVLCHPFLQYLKVFYAFKIYYLSTQVWKVVYPLKMVLLYARDHHARLIINNSEGRKRRVGMVEKMFSKQTCISWFLHHMI